MTYLEVVHLRSANADGELLDEFLEQLVTDIRRDEGSQRISLFRRAHLKTDVSLLIHHEGDQVQRPGSRLGMHLAAVLKRFGMVNHTVWTEELPHRAEHGEQRRVT